MCAKQCCRPFTLHPIAHVFARPPSTLLAAMRLAISLSLILTRLTVSSFEPPQLPDGVGLKHVLRTNSVAQRQDDPFTSTLEPTATVSEVIESSTGNEQQPTKTLTPVDQPLPLAATIGLIMPNPWETNYAGECAAVRDSENRFLPARS